MDETMKSECEIMSQLTRVHDRQMGLRRSLRELNSDGRLEHSGDACKEAIEVFEALERAEAEIATLNWVLGEGLPPGDCEPAHPIAVGCCDESEHCGLVDCPCCGPMDSERASTA